MDSYPGSVAWTVQLGGSRLKSERAGCSQALPVWTGGSRKQGFALNFVTHTLAKGRRILCPPNWWLVCCLAILAVSHAWKHSLVEIDVLMASVNRCGTFRPSELEVVFFVFSFSSFSTLWSLFFPTQGRTGDSCHSWTKGSTRKLMTWA